MNELQQVELRLLENLITVCGQLGLRCYLVCGSALGAVKYRGFIPWDDDIDVALPRPDYEVFVRQAQALLPEHIFLQNYRTDSAFPYIFSKLRDSRTTYVEKSMAKLPIHHGVYIDVFPLDGYPQGKIHAAVFEIRKRSYQHRLNTAVDLPREWRSRLHYRFYRLLGCHKQTAKTAARFEKMLSAYPVEQSQFWCNHGNWQGKLEYAPAEQYGKGTIACFEGLEVPVPERFDEYLRQKYGDYTRDLPRAEQRGHHDCLVCDLERPYADYAMRDIQ